MMSENEKKDRRFVVFSASYAGYGLTKEAVEWLANKGNEKAKDALKKGFWNSEFLIKRHDFLLTECVAYLGDAAGIGRLVIKELKGQKYSILNYNGFEYVVEPGEIKWVEVEDEHVRNF